MKVIVDKMPSKPSECPYSKDESTMDWEKHTCLWNASGTRNFTCYDTGECPYFTDKKHYNA